MSQDKDDVLVTREEHFAALWPTLPKSPLHFLTALTVLVAHRAALLTFGASLKRLYLGGSLFSHLFTFLAF